jgi:pSer/pThr/pTyr-binding forkhead associated (FHA) protein
MNTKNGTQLNGEDVGAKSQVPLNSGDEILVGKTLRMKFTEKK